MGDTWLTSSNGDVFLDAEEYNSREEAIEAGHRNYGGKHFYIAKRGHDVSIPPMRGDSVIDRLRESMADDVGWDLAGEQLECTREQEKELGDALDDAVLAWAKKHDLMPVCFTLDDVECIEAATPQSLTPSGQTDVGTGGTSGREGGR